MSLDDTDFTRLKLTTRIIKAILRTQMHFTTSQQIIEEEYLDAADTADETLDETENTEQNDAVEEAAQNHPSEETIHRDSHINPINPYQGMTLEHVSYTKTADYNCVRQHTPKITAGPVIAASKRCK